MLNIYFYADRLERSHGVTLRNSLDDQVSPEAVRDNWDEISNFDENSVYPKFIEVPPSIIHI